MPIKKRWIVRFLLFVIIIAVVIGIFLWNPLKKEASDNKLILYGNVDIRQVNLSFNITEHIRQMLVEEGKYVEKGQLLASLEKSKLNAAVLSKTAKVKAQENVVARMEAGSRPQEIEMARAEYEAAKARAKNAADTNKRFQTLKEMNAESAQNADDAKAKALITASESQAAKQKLDLLIEGPRQEDIAETKATLELYKAELEIAKCNLADANLYAPSSGVIQNRILEPGDMASPQVPVYILALTDPVWIRTYISETDLGKIHQGMQAKVNTDSFPGKTYSGWIGYISPTSEFTPKSVETTDVRTNLVYQIRVYVNNPENQLRLGMPATVLIDLPTNTQDK